MRAYRPIIVLIILGFVFAFMLLGSGGRRATTARVGDRAPSAESRDAAPNDAGNARSAVDAATQATLLEAYGKFPLSFEANRGQVDERVKFLSRGLGYTLFLTGQEAVLTLRGAAQDSAPAGADQSTQEETAAVLRMKLVGANPSPRVEALDQQPGRSNYFIGNDPSKWQTNVANYSKVRYSNAYPGVDLVYYGNQRQLEYDFVVAPGADPRAVVLDLQATPRVGSASDGRSQTIAQRSVPLKIASNGDLIVTTANGRAIRFSKPVVYQPEKELHRPELVASRHAIDGRWVLKGESRLGFEVGAYDVRKPLVIDPALSYSTYLGGGAYDSIFGLTLDSAGNAYVTGDTSSSDFPMANALQSSYHGNHDAFVTKFNLTGSALVYSTYLGGTNYDRAVGIAVDAAGNAYLAGTTGSTDFPVTSGAFQTVCGCKSSKNSDAFVAKLNSTGSTLVYSTFLGGTQNDYGSAIVLNSAGDAFVAGRTCSADFPITGGAFQTTYAAGCSGLGGEAYVSRLNATGTALIYSTYLGGTNLNAAYAVGLDSSNNAYVAGSTNSTDFPATAGAFQTTLAGGFDSFVAKVNATGSALVYASYLGGNGDDTTWGIRVDSSGSAYLAGQTISTNFPTTSGAFQTSCGGGCTQTDGVVTKFSPDGSSLVYSTYLGGSGVEEAFAIAVDSAGEAIVTGETGSTNFPTTPGSFQPTPPGGFAAFVTKLNSEGTKLAYSTYFGNSSTTGLAIAVDDAAQSFVVAGRTYSTTFPTTPGAFTTTCSTDCTQANKNSDGFVAEFVDGDQIWPLSLNFGNQVVGTTSAALKTVLTNSTSGKPLHVATITVTGANSADFVKTSDNCGSAILVGGHCTINLTFTPSVTGAENATLSVADDAANTPQQVILQGNGTHVQLVPSSISFAKQKVGTQSGSKQIAMTNKGSGTLNISGISVTGANAGDFSQNNTCGATLATGAKCLINVTFTPSATGARTGAISISDDGGGSPQQVPLSGTGS